jgi:hypothetical protein
MSKVRMCCPSMLDDRIERTTTRAVHGAIAGKMGDRTL